VIHSAAMPCQAGPVPREIPEIHVTRPACNSARAPADDHAKPGVQRAAALAAAAAHADDRTRRSDRAGLFVGSGVVIGCGRTGRRNLVRLTVRWSC